MAGERRINWGADATAARYRTEDTGDGANFVVAEDLDGGTVLLEYDDSRTPSEWVVRGPVDLDGNDLSAGAIDATSVTTGSLNTDEQIINDILDATGLTLSGDPQSPTIPLSWTGSDYQRAVWTNDETVAGDNSATSIASFRGDEPGGEVGVVTVCGQQQGGTKMFSDIVNVASDTHSVTSTVTRQGGGLTRSYSISSGRLQLAIDQSGETYDVGVVVDGGNQP